jgi:prolyl-tRNA editing enzyme YbaK/EbsC (Cys-tRNA(Pro) deacylase)
MADSLRSAAQRVQDALNAAGVECSVVEMPATTRTAKEAAMAIGCTVAQIAKSLVFRTVRDRKPILVIASGTNRVNESKLVEALGEPIELADADYVRQWTGFAIGGVPPIGHTTTIDTLIDSDLLKFDVIWAAAGTPHAVFRLTPTQLTQITNGKVIPIT